MLPSQSNADSPPPGTRPGTLPGSRDPGAGQAPPHGHHVVCGDDALAYRLTHELAEVYGARVVVLLPSVQRNHGPQLLDLSRRRGLAVDLVEAPLADDSALREAGVPHAVALALAYRNDQANIHAALRARRLNPQLRLVVRLFNRKLGRHLEDLLDRSVTVQAPHLQPTQVDASTTVLSDADTAAPALAAAAVAGSSKAVRADNLILRAVELSSPPGPDDEDPCTLALVPSADADSASGSSRRTSGRAPAGWDSLSGEYGPPPLLLPDDETVRVNSTTHARIVLQTAAPETDTARSVPQLRLPAPLPVGSLFSRRLRAVVAGLVVLEVLLAAGTWAALGGSPLRAAHLSLLDMLAIGDPADGDGVGRELLQLFSALAGMALMPVLLAVVLERLGAFRTATALRVPPRSLTDHVVLLGLGKVGSRVLDELHALGVPVVCVERDPLATGVALARSRHVPVVVGDVTQEGVLEDARIAHARAFLALTSSDSTNLEATLYVREREPGIRVVLRLFDDSFAAAVYRALRDSYPQASTISRSVSTLAAPAFAAAMMGRQILGAIPVARQVLLFAVLDVGEHPELVDRPIEEVFRPGVRRVVALDVAAPHERRPDLAVADNGTGTDDPARSRPEPELVWSPHPGYMLQARDRVVMAVTRHGLAELLAGRVRAARGGPDPTA